MPVSISTWTGVTTPPATERSATAAALTFPCGKVDWETRELRCDVGSVQVLSEREAKLLDYLARHPGRAIDRDELLRGVWQIDAKGVTTRTVDMHVARLRDKLKSVCDNREAIKTVRGQGYMIEPSLVESS